MIYTYKGGEYTFNHFINSKEITIYSPEGLTKKAKCEITPSQRRFRTIPVYGWNQIIYFECRG